MHPPRHGYGSFTKCHFDGCAKRCRYAAPVSHAEGAKIPGVHGAHPCDPGTLPRPRTPMPLMLLAAPCHPPSFLYVSGDDEPAQGGRVAAEGAGLAANTCCQGQLMSVPVPFRMVAATAAPASRPGNRPSRKRGRMPGDAKCITCRKKGRPCGPPCPNWPAHLVRCSPHLVGVPTLRAPAHSSHRSASVRPHTRSISPTASPASRHGGRTLPRRRPIDRRLPMARSSLAAHPTW